MKQILDIDFISDIACPWCVVGLYALEKALMAFPDITATFHIHPFELDSAASTQGENMIAHIERKYDIPAEEVRQGQAEITRRGAEVGFRFNFTDASRTWNTFDAHRIIHWAEPQGKALDMKKALFSAYFTENLNPSDHGLLARLAGENGLDPNAALEILARGDFAEDVRKAIQLWKDRGVSAVPTIRLQGRQTFTGAQTVDTFTRAINDVVTGSRSSGMPLM